MDERIGPLLTRGVCDALLAATRAGAATLECSLDLGRSTVTVVLHGTQWEVAGVRYPLPEACKDRTIYRWLPTQRVFEPLARFSGGLVKLVPTDWGPPTFEIDGIKMLPTARISPFADAARKVGLIAPRGKVVLDCCGGLGYFAHWCLQEGAAQVLSFEKNAQVLWLREHNPWSPAADARLVLTHASVVTELAKLPAGSVDACLHDPPRFGIAGELYSQSFYDGLARVLKPRGRLFHYTGTPNKLTSGRDVPREVQKRLQRAGFEARAEGDGLLAVRR